jgi:RND superfamily putative drug exporter
VFGTFGLVAVASHVLPMANEVQPLVLLIGLAVGVDYSMFYLRREREERAKGRSERAALEAAAATFGPVGADLRPDRDGRDGRHVRHRRQDVRLVRRRDDDGRRGGDARARSPCCRRCSRGSATGSTRSASGAATTAARAGCGAGSSTAFCGGPALSAAIAGGALLLLALPAIQMRMADASPDTYPAQLEVVKTYKRMQQAFPGTALPANVIVKAPNVNAPAVREAISELEQRALASGRAHEPITMAVNRAGTVANITIPIDGNGTDKESNASLALLRKTIIPETVGALPNTEAGVTGLTAQWKDSGDQIRSALPLVGRVRARVRVCADARSRSARSSSR